MQVPLLDLKAQFERIADPIRGAVDRVLTSQRFILGDEVTALEAAVAERVGVPHAVGVASGSDALLLALMARDVGHGSEVITTPFTFFATAGSVNRLHAKIVFVDIEPETFNLDVGAVAAAISDETRAILPVHLFGQCADMDDLAKAIGEREIAVIEDACQSMDATWAGRTSGSMGDFGCFSFFPSKNLGGFGDGGMVTARSQEDADRLRRLRTHGGAKMYLHDEVGINSRLDALQAAILRVKLEHLTQWTDARRANARRYRELFADAGVDDVVLPTERKEHRHVYNQFTIRAPRRDELRDHLKGAGVGCAIYYPLPLHLQPCFSKMGHKEGDFPHAEKASKEVLSLPVYPELTADQQSYVVESIKSFYRG